MKLASLTMHNFCWFTWFTNFCYAIEKNDLVYVFNLYLIYFITCYLLLLVSYSIFILLVFLPYRVLLLSMDWFLFILRLIKSVILSSLRYYISLIKFLFEKLFKYTRDLFNLWASGDLTFELFYLHIFGIILSILCLIGSIVA